MPKSQFVQDLYAGAGIEVDSPYCIVDPQPSSGNGPHKLKLRDRTNVISAKIWPSANVVSWDVLQESEFAEVRGVTEVYGQRLEVKITGFRPFEKPRNLKDYIPCYPGDMTPLRIELRDLVDSVKTIALRALLTSLFIEDERFRRAYFDAPAAQSMHHPYLGGLLEHSLEVAKICDSIARELSGLSRDLLVTAALLHDAGKIEELDYKSTGFAFTRKGGMLGHVFLGAHRVYSRMASLPDCPDDLADALCHLLLSHQGKPEWGSPVFPCIREAHILHLADDMSAKDYHFKKALSDSSKETFQKAQGLEGRVYTGSRSWDEGESESSEASRIASDKEGRFDAAERSPMLRISDAASTGESEDAGMDRLRESGDAGADRLRDAENAARSRDTVETDDSPRLPDNVIPLFRDVIMLPIVGSVAAGIPQDEREAVEDYRPLAKSDGAREGEYLLRVKGDSMIDAHLLDGDLARVRPLSMTSIEEGDIVVARIDGEYTVKRLAFEGVRAILKPANPAYSDIHPTDEMRIEGKVVGVIRPAL